MITNMLPIVVALAAAMALPVHAARTPNALSTDARIRQVQFDPNQVYEVTGTYGYQTTLEFGAGEAVVSWAVGDSIAWQVRHDPNKPNKLYLKPVEPNAISNLTVETNRHTYYLSLGSARDRKSATFAVRFIHQGGGSEMAVHRPQQPAAAAQQGGTGQGWLVDPAKQNTDYGWSGDRKAVRLKRAFDDGQFTWFQFEEGAEIPVIYVVAPDGTEATVNTRRQGNFVVVERTAAQFTLRTGPGGRTTLCVRNNAKG